MAGESLPCDLSNLVFLTDSRRADNHIINIFSGRKITSGEGLCNCLGKDMIRKIQLQNNLLFYSVDGGRQDDNLTNAVIEGSGSLIS